MIANARDVIDHRLLRIGHRKPRDVFSGTRTVALADIMESVPAKLGGFKTVGEQTAHHLVREVLHPAVCVVDDKELPRAQQLVADHKGADGIVACSNARIADHMSIAFCKPRVLGRVKTRVHARQHGKASRWWQGKFALVTEVTAVILVS